MTELAELPEADVLAAREELLQLLGEAYPGADFRGGVLSDIVLELNAALATHSRAQVGVAMRSASLLEINADPELAEDTLVDRVLSNYRVERQEGANAEGDVVIVLDTLTTASVGSNTRFAGNGQEFRTTTAYTAKVSAAAVLAETDRLLTPLGDGTFGFTVPVTAVAIGVASMLKRGTTLSASVPFQHYVKSYAAADFVGGFDAETNEDLVAKLTAGMAVHAWSNRATVDSMIRQQDEFARILQTSLIGYGDEEMTRDQRSIFPISTGGRTDLFVRTQELPRSLSLTKTATLMSTTAAGGVWQLTIDRDDAPAMYDVTWIARAEDGPTAQGYEVTTDVRGSSMPTIDETDEYLPDVTSGLEATYSSYQTVVIQILDTDTPTGSLEVGVSQQDYSLVVRAMPLVTELQEYLTLRSVRPPQCDVLVRAPVPCFLGLTLDLVKRSTTPTPDTEGVKQALTRAVNQLGFPGQLLASQLSDAIYTVLDDGVTVGRIDMHGRLRLPDGDFVRLRSFDTLVIPNRPELFTSGRTTAFLLDPADIHISIVATTTPEV
jgi:uncharacterized phage protein gp47/JayE